MTDLEKTIWRASRGTPDALSTLLTRLFADIESLQKENAELTGIGAALHSRIAELEQKRGPGRPPKG
jgi:hypothetical protein